MHAFMILILFLESEIEYFEITKYISQSNYFIAFIESLKQHVVYCKK